MREIPQRFEPYTKWEDWQSGLWRDVTPDEQPELIAASSELLSSPEQLHGAMIGVIDEWEVASAVNMTNRSQNRRAWLGQAACLLKVNSPEQLTRLAWNQLTKLVQGEANEVADLVIEEWYRREQCQSVQLELMF